METVFLRNRKLQDLQTSLQICNKICTDRDWAGFAQLCRIAIIIVSITEKGGENGQSSNMQQNLHRQTETGALHSFAELQLFLQFYSAK